MKRQAAEALYEAQRRGVRQIKGAMLDESGGLCALGVILTAGLGQPSGKVDGCPLCGGTSDGLLAIDCELRLIVHLNDHHELTFSEIARKLGPDAA